MRRTLTLILGVTLALVAGVGPASGFWADFFDDNASGNAIYEEMVIGPTAVYSEDYDGTKDRTIVAYQGPDLAAYVMWYGHSTSNDGWHGPYRVGDNPLWEDPFNGDLHGGPALFVDEEQGLLHIFWGSHGSEQKHAVADLEGNLSKWTERPATTGYATYPQPISMTPTRTALFYRGLYESWVYKAVDADNFDDVRLGSEQTVLDTGYRFYSSFAEGGTPTTPTVHSAFVRSTSADPFDRYDVFYKQATTSTVFNQPAGANTWQSIEASMVVSNANPTVLEQKGCLVFDSNGKTSVNQVLVKDDGDGNPCILFLAGEPPSSFTWKFAHWNGVSWDITDITDTDHFFDAGTFDVQWNGDVHAYVVSGGSTGEAETPYSDRGGDVEKWVLKSGSSNWSRERTVLPERVAPTLYNDPQVVGGPFDWTIGKASYHADAALAFCEWDNEGTNFIRKVFLYGNGKFAQKEFFPEVSRLEGPTRIQTAVAVSQQAYPSAPRRVSTPDVTKGRFVVLATAREFPDALAGAPLADALGCPLLLTEPGYLPDDVAEEIQRLQASHVVVLGGPGAVSGVVWDDLVLKAGISRNEGRRIRIGGTDRYDTARLIAEELATIMEDRGLAIDTVALATGENFPDALSVSGLAAHNGYPILLSRVNMMPPSTEAAFEDLTPSETLVVGGEGVLDAGIAAQVPGPLRLAGTDRYGTATAVAREGFERGMSMERFTVATGLDFPDALAGGVLAGRIEGTMLLTRGTEEGLSLVTRDFVEAEAWNVLDAYVLGGEGAVTPAAATDLEELLYMRQSFAGPD
jgi:putative cell wall-binding protein